MVLLLYLVVVDGYKRTGYGWTHPSDSEWIDTVFTGSDL
jgi:hypothetical protein